MKIEITYRGLRDLNDKGKPYFTQWGYKLPVLTIDTPQGSQIVQLTEKQIIQFERFERDNHKLTIFDLNPEIEKANSTID